MSNTDRADFADLFVRCTETDWGELCFKLVIGCFTAFSVSTTKNENA
ncbi:hypothetical protein [Fluviicola chungangensis]|nr:hypothetical protein [Fluviicola chungangensis]